MGRLPRVKLDLVNYAITTQTKHFSMYSIQAMASNPCPRKITKTCGVGPETEVQSPPLVLLHRATLEFGVEIDQTYLPSVLNQLEVVMSYFPILGQPRMS